MPALALWSCCLLPATLSTGPLACPLTTGTTATRCLSSTAPRPSRSLRAWWAPPWKSPSPSQFGWDTDLEAERRRPYSATLTRLVMPFTPKTHWQDWEDDDGLNVCMSSSSFYFSRDVKILLLLLLLLLLCFSVISWYLSGILFVVLQKIITLIITFLLVLHILKYVSLHKFLCCFVFFPLKEIKCNNYKIFLKVMKGLLVSSSVKWESHTVISLSGCWNKIPCARKKSSAGLYVRLITSQLCPHFWKVAHCFLGVCGCSNPCIPRHVYSAAQCILHLLFAFKCGKPYKIEMCICHVINNRIYINNHWQKCLFFYSCLCVLCRDEQAPLLSVLYTTVVLCYCCVRSLPNQRTTNQLNSTGNSIKWVNLSPFRSTQFWKMSLCY